MTNKIQVFINVFFGITLALVVLFLFSNISTPPISAASVGANINEPLAVNSAKTDSSETVSKEEFVTEISALKLQLASISHSLSEIASRDRLSGFDPTIDSEVEVASSPEERRLEAKLRQEQRDFAIATEFESQAVDDIWSSETGSVMDEILIDPRLTSLGFSNPDCRSNTCKLDIHYSDDQQANEDSESYLLSEVGKFMPRAKGVQNPDGSTSIYFYSKSHPSNQRVNSPQ